MKLPAFGGEAAGDTEERGRGAATGHLTVLDRFIQQAILQVLQPIFDPPKALDGFKERIRQITSRNGGRSLPKVVEELRAYLLGWKGYFRLADTPGVFRDLDQWIARRLRMVQLKQWKNPPTVFRELRRRGVPERIARAAAAWGRRWWGLAKHGALNTALPGKHFEQMGLPRLQPH